jgi:hypothetical protein
MRLNRSQRYDYISPVIAAALMDNVLKQYFYGRNLITGENQKNGNIFAIDHSASAYISPAALKRREFYRFIAKIFGENHWITQIVLRLKDIIWRLHYSKHLISIRVSLIKLFRPRTRH